MPARILIVDGSDTDRQTVAAMLGGAGCEVEQAPDGVEAFESVLAQGYDLVVADAKLDRLDTPDLIVKLRGRGIKTPVLVLTAVTKAATLGVLKKLGIVDYVHKAMPADVVRDKILAALPAPAPDPAGAVPTEVPSAPSARASTATGGVLLIDASEAEHQRLRAQLPPAVALDACKAFNDGLAHARRGRYRMVLIDADAAVLNLGGIVVQMHVLQPEAAVVAAATLGKHDERSAVKISLEGLGFDDAIFKPFSAGEIGLLAQWYCTTWQDLVTVTDDLIEVSRLRCRKDQREKYLHELATRIEAAFAPLSNACFDRAILDLTRVDQLSAADAAELLARLDRSAGALGVSLLVAVAAQLGTGLQAFKDIYRGEQFRCYPSAAAARAAMG